MGKIKEKSKKYEMLNWKEIQDYYDLGNTWNKTCKHFKISNKAMNWGTKFGPLKLRSKSTSLKLSFKNPFRKKTSMSLESRMELSQKQSLKNRGGKCKWFDYNGQKLQGTWELNLAKKFDLINVCWEKLKTNKDIISYNFNGKLKSYTPDFFLKELNVFLDPKGYWWGNDKEKIKFVKEQNPDLNLLILEKKDYFHIINTINSKEELYKFLCLCNSNGRVQV